MAAPTVDPSIIVRNLIKDISFSVAATVSVRTSPYNDISELPCVVVHLVRTERPPHNVGDTQRKGESYFTIYCNALTKVDKYAILKDVRDQLDTSRKSPGTDYKYITADTFVELDDYEASPQVFTTAITARLFWWESLE